MVDICVNLGVKPRVHYQKGYPCEEIAELFEQQVGECERVMNRFFNLSPTTSLC